MNQHDKYQELISNAERDGVRRYVVAAVLDRERAVLLLQRPDHEFMGGIWELPSGRVEPGETLEAALGREIAEETGLAVASIDQYLGHFDYLSGSGRPTRQFNFAVTSSESQTIVLTEHADHAWVSENESEYYPITDSVRSALADYWKRHVS